MTATEAPVVGLTPGVVLVGEYLGTDLPREYTNRANEVKTTRPAVRLLVGRRIEVVSFRDLAALDAAVGNPVERDIIAVPVWLNGPWNEAANRPGAANVTFSGRAPLEERD